MSIYSKTFLMLGMLTFGFLLLSAGASASSNSERSIAGHWVMHLYLGNRLFDDKVYIEKDNKGKLSGKLSVPDRFTVPLRNIRVTDKTLSFDIEADEGKGPFHVKYEGTFYSSGNTFIGFATVTDDNSLLGGFVGQKID